MKFFFPPPPLSFYVNQIFDSSLCQNVAAKTIICKVCRQDWQSTQKRPALEEHAQNKHSKTYDECFA